MSAFDQVSSQYQQKALVQQAAAERLLALLNIGEKEDVLDVGCGPGHITKRIKAITHGRVVGTGISAGMIAANQPPRSIGRSSRGAGRSVARSPGWPPVASRTTPADGRE